MRLIDADALINTLQELFDKREKEARFTGDKGATVTWNDAIYHIKTAPTIEERKTGKWVIDDEYIDCSVCRHEKWSRVPFEDLVKRFKFCPNCGADMRRHDEGTADDI